MDLRDGVRASNAASAFNRWLGIEIVELDEGFAEISIAPRPELTQHAGFLHAGIVAALLDTAAGYAAVTACKSNATTTQLSTSFYIPALGEKFVAKARVARAGKRQVFVDAQLFARSSQGERLVAGATAVLVPIP